MVALAPSKTDAILFQVLSQVYPDGIDRVLEWELTEEASVVGRFVDENRVFGFEISQEDIIFFPLKDSEIKKDSYLTAYLSTATRFDQKKRNCTKNTSYSCGSSCINNEKVCRITQQEIDPGLLTGLIESAINAASQPTQPTNPILQNPGAMGKQGAMAQGASVAQVEAPVYSQFRANYRSGFAQSAERAKIRAKTIEVEDIGDKGHVTFAVGGFTGEGKKGGDRLKGYVDGLGLEDHHVVAIDNSEFDVPEGVTTNNPLQFGQESFRTMLNSTLSQGYNPTAVEVSAHVKAYRDKYPKAKFSVLGHSGGGIAAHEAAEITENHMGISLTTATMGSPWFGLTEPTKSSISFASKKDPIVRLGNVMNPVWTNNVAGHSQADYFSDPSVTSQLKVFLGDTPKKDKKKRSDAIPNIRPRPPLGAIRQLVQALVPVLEGSYLDGVDRIVDVNAKANGDVSGLFLDGTKLLEFDIIGNQLSYKLAMKTRRDSWLAGYLEIEYTNTRIDAKRAKNCKTGISCGLSCISSRKTCQVDLSKVASPAARSRLRNASINVAQQTMSKANDNLDDLTIRELKDEARKRQIYRYSEMDSKQLKESIRFVDNNPQKQQDRIAKTVKKRKEGSATLNRFGVTGQVADKTEPVSGRKVNPEKTLVEAVRKYERVQRIMKLADIDPSMASLAVGAIMTGVSLQAYNKMRDNYRFNLPASAKTAEERARKMQVNYTPRGNITFAVGGYSAEGSTGEKLKDTLEAQAYKEDATEQDRWFKDKHQIIPVETSQFQIGDIKSAKYLKDGKTYNPVYLAELSTKSAGSYLRNLRRGKNDDAVELAAQIYAHANYRSKSLAERQRDVKKAESNFKAVRSQLFAARKDPELRENTSFLTDLEKQVEASERAFQNAKKRRQKDRLFTNDNKNINIIAHSTGGNTVHEALEILGRMNERGAKPGREVLKRLNVTTIGTTDFGLMDKNLANERNITSAQDPFSFLPQRNSKWVSMVRGHEIEDYMKSPEVVDQLLQSFGYFDRTIYDIENRG